MLQEVINAQHRMTFSLLLVAIVETFVMEWKYPIQLWATAVVVNQAMFWPALMLSLAMTLVKRLSVLFAVHKVLLMTLILAKIVQIAS